MSEDALLVITELVTNSVKHAATGDANPRVTLGFVLRPGRLRIEVGDLGRTDWVEHHRGEELGSEPCLDVSGHGLDLVRAIADQTGHAPAPTGHVSWAELCWTTTELPAATPHHPPRAHRPRRKCGIK